MSRSKTYELSFQVGATLSGSFSKVFKGAGTALQELNGQMGAMAKQQAATAQLVSLRRDVGLASREFMEARQKVAALGQQLAATANPSKQMRTEFAQAEAAVKKAKASLEQKRAALQSLNTQLGATGKSTQQLVAHQKQLAAHAEKAAAAQKKLQGIVAAQDANKAKRGDMRGQLFDATALAVTMGAPIKAAIELESSMADVAKVVDFKDGEAGLKAMSQSVIDMSKRLPMAAKDIAQIVALGGQSGLDEKELTGFAEHAVKMGTAFGMTAEEAGSSMAKMKSAFGMSIPEVAELTDKINLLGNTGAANEKQILNIVGRVGPLGKVAGVASGEIAALGSTLAGMGVQEEVAATGIQNLMLTLVSGKAASKGAREAFAQLGLDAVKVAKGMQKNATGTMQEVFQKLRGLKDYEQASVMTQLFGKESIKAIAPLLNQLETLDENFKKVADSQKYGGAVEKEYAARAATTANRLQLARNQMAAMGVTLGNVMLPAINDTLQAIMPWMDRITGLAQAYPGLTKALVMGTAALVAAKVAAVAGGYAFTFVRGAVLSVQATLAAARAGWLLYTGAMVASNATSKAAVVVSRAMTAAQWLFNAALRASPIGLVITAIGGLVAAGVYLWRNWDQVTAAAGRMWEGMKAGATAAAGWVVGKMQSAANWLMSFSLVQGAVKIGADFGAAFLAFVDSPKQFVMNALQRAKDWLMGFSLFDSGVALLQTLAQGIMSAISKPVEAIKGALSKVREYLPFSDAKVGPLSELTLSGQKIMTTLGEGMGKADIGQVTAPLGGIASALQTGAVSGGAPAAAASGATYNITINVPAGQDPAAARAAGRAAADSFAQQMKNYEERNRRLSFANA